jgi:hypothetical protein
MGTTKKKNRPITAEEQVKLTEKKENLEKFGKLTRAEKYLFGKCGIFCQACSVVYTNEISKPARALRKVLDDLNISDPFHLVAPREKYENFRDVLSYFIDGFHCSGCGDPNYHVMAPGAGDCPVRMCTREKGVFTCADCPEFEEKVMTGGVCSNPTMPLLNKRYSNWNVENLKRIKTLGYERHFQWMQEKIRSGFTTMEVISQERVFTPNCPCFNPNRTM